MWTKLDESVCSVEAFNLKVVEFLMLVYVWKWQSFSDLSRSTRYATHGLDAEIQQPLVFKAVQLVQAFQSNILLKTNSPKFVI